MDSIVLPTLPIEIVHKILIMRETHDIAKCIRNLNNTLFRLAGESENSGVSRSEACSLFVRGIHPACMINYKFTVMYFSADTRFLRHVT
jgi:hypothetical protein